jgi:hypothetical protein
LRRPLPSTLTFKYPTVELLTDYLITELFPHVQGHEVVAAVAAPRAATASLAAPAAVPSDDDIDATEDELFDQLAARLLQERN